MMMTRKKANNTCRRIRARLYSAVNTHLGPGAGWFRGHIAHCPRCQRRLVSTGKVHLALSFMKAQPHGLDLLRRANEKTISVLKHSLQQEPKAQDLKAGLSEQESSGKYSKYGFSIGSLAACMAILFLMKLGIFSSVDNVQSRGRKVIKQYYVNQIGQDLADEVFPGETKPPAAKPPDMTNV
jgi:hypothetical protein